jgi:hypothetical protein
MLLRSTGLCATFFMSTLCLAGVWFTLDIGGLPSLGELGDGATALGVAGIGIVSTAVDLGRSYAASLFA